MVNLNLNISPDFFEEEERSGFLVSKKMKEVWAVELDLLAEFDRVCKKHNLTYYADGGTLLGAIRHKGFIPWDDDIDLIMMRDQYERLCKIAHKEFEAPYFFQTEFSDPASLRGHAQLRNSETTAILNADFGQNCPFNQGIFIDIFPIDAVPDSAEEFEKKIQSVGKNLKLARKLARLTDRYSKASKGGFLKRVAKSSAHMLASGPLRSVLDYDKWYVKYEQACQQYNDNQTEMVAKYFAIPFCRNQVWYRKDFSAVEKIQFEMIEIPIPIGYKRILDIFFGEDWMTPKKLPTYHSGVLFDVDRSYTDYIE